METAGLTYVFPDGNGIKNITFQVMRGEIYALYGGHNAGKSVLLQAISTALDMDYSLYKYWVVGLSHSLQINTIGEDLIPILVTLGIYLFLPTAISFSLFQRLDLRGLERR